RRYGVVVVLAASAHRRVKKTKDLWRDAVDEDDDVMRLMIIQLRFRFSAKGGALIGLELLIIDEQV
ncbi:hypothetical protein IGI04_006850, partial [Brassica rapa subsp. trilocularis]